MLINRKNLKPNQIEPNFNSVIFRWKFSIPIKPRNQITRPEPNQITEIAGLYIYVYYENYSKFWIKILREKRQNKFN